MFVVTATGASPLRWGSLNDDVSSGDRQRNLSVGLPRHTGVVCKGHQRVGHFVVTEHQRLRTADQELAFCTDTATVDMNNAIENELSKIEGLDKLKLQLTKWLKGMILDERRRAFGLQVGPRKLPQLVFLGNPGTGKTMIARMLSKLLHMVGILRRDKVIEVQRTDLVSKYIGETGSKTRKKIEEAKGGILFVDEAYRLVPKKRSKDDVGLEALEEIMSYMDNGKVVVIFAGYTEPMNRVLSSNEGIRRRISNIFHFDDFNCEQLAKILHLKLPNKDVNSPFYGFKLDPKCTSVKDVAALIEQGTSAEQRRKMNGGLIDQMLVKARENLDSRINMECTDEYAMVAITSQDLAVGLQLLRAEEKGENYEQTGGRTGAHKARRLALMAKKLAQEIAQIEVRLVKYDHAVVEFQRRISSVCCYYF